MKKIAIFSFLLCLIVVSSTTARTPQAALQDNREKQQWVDSVFRSMSVERRVGQIIAQVVDPRNMKSAKTEIKRLTENYHIGVIYFSEGRIRNHIELANYTNSLSETPVMVAIDGEWGLSMRMPDMPLFPRNMTLGAIQDDRLIYEYGEEVARECRLAGISINFAPSVDVNSNPDNPVIGTRSFGEDPANVARKSVAYAKGLEDGGVMSVAKHFPGHGDTHDDSHKTLPVVNHTYMDMRASDLVPFYSYVRAGLSGVMVAHLKIPALKTGDLPSSLSKNVVTNLLKSTMGFKGLVFTDALAMKGARVKGQPNGLLALRAGAEVLLEPFGLEDNFKALVTAYKKGGEDKRLIDSACRKILAYKYTFGLDNPKPVNAEGVESRVNNRKAELMLRKLYGSAVTALKNEADILPVKKLDGRICVVSLGAKANNTFSEVCAKYTKVERYAMTDDNASDVVKAVKNASKVIVGVFDDDPSIEINFDRLLMNVDENKVIPVFFIKPYNLKKFSGSISLCNTAVLAYENHRFAQDYAAQAIFGGSDLTGRIPVTVDGVANCGDGVSIYSSRLGYGMAEEVGLDARFVFQADSLAKEGIKKGAYTGCQVLVARHNKIVFNRNYGYTDNTKKYKVTGNTLFDLASVTKATGTLSGIMKAVDMRKINIDARLSSYIPSLKGTPKGELTIRELLYHETGMPAALNVYKIMTDTGSYSGSLVASQKSKGYLRYAGGGYINNSAKVRRDITSPVKTGAMDYRIGKNLYVGKITYDSIMGIIHNMPLRSDRDYLYSCLNFCLLMEAEQNAVKTRHDKFVYDNIFHRLGSYRTVYRPLSFFSKSNIAATELDEYLRGEMVDGSVHDETAAFSGGIQGNAGLFSNAGDLAKLCAMWRDGGMYGGEQILSPSTVRLFTTSKSPLSHRGLGFDKPNTVYPERSSVCEEADPSVYGHTGFTGTCFWVDPKNDIIYIFLSNRVCPSRNNPAFSEVGARAGIFSLVYQSLKRACK